jgi:hypothetical protein
MIPSCERFLAGIGFYARRHALPTRYDDSAIAEALVEAERLAVIESDEPAALFFSCARRSRAFAGVAGRIVPFVTRRHAESLGLKLNVDDLELEILRARILLRAIDFGELRARFAACLSTYSPPP